MAGGIGMALGGFAESFQRGQAQNSIDDYRTQELKIQQQGLKNQQQREMYLRADKAREQMWTTITDVVTAAKDAGHSNQEIAQLIAPVMQPLKKLAISGGMPDTPAMYDAQFATLLAKPSAFDAMGGRSSTPARSASRSPAVASQSGAAANPANPDLDPNEQLGVRNQPANFSQRFAGDDVDRLTRAMSLAGDNSGLRAALAARLNQALKQTGDDTQAHVLKDENGGEHVLFIDPRKRTVTDSNGNPYVAPGGGDSDAKQIVKAMQEGKQPPVFTGLYRDSKKVRAEAERQGFNVSQAQLEWDAAKKQVLSLNGPQMVRYAGLAKSVLNTIDETKSLAEQMNNTGVPLYNRARLAKYIQTEGNSENGQLAAKYLATVNTLKEEFANLAQGGYAPTEPAWALANQQVNGDYGVKELGASLTEVQRLLRYRLNGIPNFNTLGPGAANRYVGGGSAEQPSTPSAPNVDVKKLSDDELKAIIGGK